MGVLVWNVLELPPLPKTDYLSQCFCSKPSLVDFLFESFEVTLSWKIILRDPLAILVFESLEDLDPFRRKV